jgi:hypothetical protein
MRKFLTPRELKAQLEDAAEGLPPGHFIRKPQYQQLKESWCAAHFGLGYQRHVAPCAVWVNSAQASDTDFVLQVNDNEFAFQTTLADVPERRMGDDHKPGADGRFPSRPYEPSRGSVEGPAWIADAVRKKVESNYAGSENLNVLVYANFPSDGLDYAATCARVDEVASPFASIWIVTNHQICSVKSFSGLGAVGELRMIYDTDELFAL